MNRLAEGLKRCDSEDTAERADRGTDGGPVAAGLGTGCSLTATRVRVSFWGDDEVLELGGVGHTTAVNATSLLMEMVQRLNFMLCDFHHDLKIPFRFQETDAGSHSKSSVGEAGETKVSHVP